MSSTAWTIAVLSVLCVVAPSLSWVSFSGVVIDQFAKTNGREIFLPRLLGALVAVTAGLLATWSRPSRRLGWWAVAAFALLGQVAMSLVSVASGPRLLSRVGGGSVQTGWYVDLLVVLLGLVAVGLGGGVVTAAVRSSRAAAPSARLGVALASVALGVLVVRLLSRDAALLTYWALQPPAYPAPPALFRAAGWIVIVGGVAGPVLAVLAARERAVAVGLVCGWWAFLAVPWVQAVTLRADVAPTDPTPTAFWVGTAVAVVGGAALLAWIWSPRLSARWRPREWTAPLPDGWPARTDEDPLRR